MRIPPKRRVRFKQTHRLIPAKYLTQKASSRLVSEANQDALATLRSATSAPAYVANDTLPGVAREEMVYGEPHADIINNTFCHASPDGSRFNGPDRGAWYAGVMLETSFQEVAYHRTQYYLEVAWDREDTMQYQDLQAAFDGMFHDLRKSEAFMDCLAPRSYSASQALAARLLNTGGTGIVYPSVRHPGGICVACFRPKHVKQARQGKAYTAHWQGMEKGMAWRM